MSDKKLPWLFDLAKMPYYAASYDMATKLAGFYHVAGLQEKTEMTKVDYEAGMAKMNMGLTRGKSYQDCDPTRNPPIKIDKGSR